LCIKYSPQVISQQQNGRNFQLVNMPKVVKAPKRPQQELAWGLELQLHWEKVGHSLNQLDNNNIFMKIQKVLKYVHMVD